MGGRLAKIIVSVVSLVLAAFAAAGVYDFLKDRSAPLLTERAVVTTVTEGIDAAGTIVREESLLGKLPGASYLPLVASGERVSKGQAIALSFSSARDRDTYEQIRELDGRISFYESVIKEDFSPLGISAYNDGIYGAILKIARSSSAGIFPSGTGEARDELNKNIVLRQAAVDGKDGLAAHIGALRARRAALANEMTSYGTEVTTGTAGYFCAFADGMEPLLVPSRVTEMPPEQFAELVKFPPSSVSDASFYGKLIEGYGWHLLFDLPKATSALLSEGGSYDLVVAGAQVRARLQRKNEGEKSDLAVFYCDVPLEDVTQNREQQCRIILNTYEGFRVSAESMRIKDGDAGVFVLEGARTVYKPVEITYTGDGFYMVKENFEDRDKLFLNDEIILGEKGLWDGKVVN